MSEKRKSKKESNDFKKESMSSRKKRTNQFNDAMTEESFICCSIKGEQMVYIDWPGGPTADPLDDRRLRTCLPIKGATRYKIF